MSDPTDKPDEPAPPAPAAPGNGKRKYNPDEWTISTIAFTDPKGIGIEGMTSWSALGTGETDRKTTIEEHAGHITVCYKAGVVELRCDVSKHNCHIVRMPKARYLELKAKQQGRAA